MSTDPRTLPVEAYSFAARFPLKEVPSWLPEGTTLRLGKTLVVAEMEQQRIFVFDFGALVFVDVARARVDEILNRVKARLPREPHPPLREDFSIRLDPSRLAVEMTFDAVLAPELSATEVEAIATVLAQSVVIDYYDEDLQEILEKVGSIALGIARVGRAPGKSRDLVKFVGSAIAAQVEIMGSLALIDKPDFTWENESAERIYDLLRHNLEIQERFRALESKLVTIRESLSQFLELISTRRALFLEVTVVLLIVIEVLMGFYEILHR